MIESTIFLVIWIQLIAILFFIYGVIQILYLEIALYFIQSIKKSIQITTRIRRK